MEANRTTLVGKQSPENQILSLKRKIPKSASWLTTSGGISIYSSNCVAKRLKVVPNNN